MKETLKKYKTILTDMIKSPLYISQLPVGLKNYAASRFVVPAAVLAVALVSFFLAPFSLTFLATILLVELLAVGFSLYTCYELVSGNYYIVTGTIKAIESANMFAGAIESLTQNGKNQKLIIEQPDGTFACVYLGRKIKNDFSVGLPVIVYAENVYIENGIDTVRNYYTIVIAPSEVLESQPEETVEVEAETVIDGETE